MESTDTAQDAQAISRQVEAALMASDRPVSAAKLSEVLGKAGVRQIQSAVAALNEVYAATQRSFRVEEVAGGFQLVTLPDYAPVLRAMHRTQAQGKLSPAALETLAIVAYKQPVLRAEVESIRGVACGEVLRMLMDRRLVKIVGRSDEIGRPMLYGTTKAFLELFGLARLEDLPKAQEFRPKESSPGAPLTAPVEAPAPGAG